jgi:SAM-dependent methyltransferase
VTAPGPERVWNHNIHYHRVLLAALPESCGTALDVGCGEGILARRLRERADRVVAIDRDEASIALARRSDAAAGVEYHVGDFLTAALEPGQFDVVASVAALHHMDEAGALRRMAQLLRPGGVLAVVGLARSRYPADLPRDALAMVVSRTLSVGRGRWESPAPIVLPPPRTYAELARVAERELPGVRFRRHLMWRYSLVWEKPRAAGA